MVIFVSVWSSLRLSARSVATKLWRLLTLLWRAILRFVVAKLRWSLFALRLVVWLAPHILRWSLTLLWRAVLVVRAIRITVWSWRVVRWSLWGTLHLVAWTIAVDIYISGIETLVVAVVRLLVANGVTISVGDGCHGIAKDVGRELYLLNNHAVAISYGDDCSAKDVGVVGNLLNLTTIGVGYSHYSISENIYLDPLFAG